MWVVFVWEIAFYFFLSKQRTEKGRWKLSYPVSLALALLTLWTRQFFVRGRGGPAQCKMFGSIPGLCYLDVNSTVSFVTTKKCLQTLLNGGGAGCKITPRNTDLIQHFPLLKSYLNPEL